MVALSPEEHQQARAAADLARQAWGGRGAAAAEEKAPDDDARRSETEGAADGEAGPQLADTPKSGHCLVHNAQGRVFRIQIPPPNEKPQRGSDPECEAELEDPAVPAWDALKIKHLRHLVSAEQHLQKSEFSAALGGVDLFGDYSGQGAADEPSGRTSGTPSQPTARDGYGAPTPPSMFCFIKNGEALGDEELAKEHLVLFPSPAASSTVASGGGAARRVRFASFDSAGDPLIDSSDDEDAEGVLFAVRALPGFQGLGDAELAAKFRDWAVSTVGFPQDADNAEELEETGARRDLGAEAGRAGNAMATPAAISARGSARASWRGSMVTQDGEGDGATGSSRSTLDRTLH